MKILICGSARAEVVRKCLEDFASEHEVTAALPAGIAPQFNRYEQCENVVCVPLDGSSFCGKDREKLLACQRGPFDAVVIVSGGLDFTGFSNVLEAIEDLTFQQLIFYNCKGHKEIVKIRRGMRSKWEPRMASVFMRLFQILHPMELLAERVYIQCAELLGL